MKRILGLGGKGKGKGTSSTSVSSSSPSVDSRTQRNIPVNDPHNYFSVDEDETYIDNTQFQQNIPEHFEFDNTTTEAPEIPINVDDENVDTGEGEPKRARVQKSEVWKHFTKNEALQKTFCKHCSTSYSFKQGPGGGTGTMTRHLENKHPKIWGHPKKSSQTQTGSSSQGPVQSELNMGGRVVPRYNKANDRVEMAKFIASGCLPFSFPNSEPFVTYIQRVYNPLFDGIPRSTCRADILKLYNNYIIYLRYIFLNLSCRVSLTADIGRAVNRLDYLTVTSHWVDENFKMQTRILAFKYDESRRHTAQFIAHTILEVVSFYGLKDKIMSITFDNASNNTAAIPILVEKLRPPLSEIFHIRCACHVINLVVRDGLSQFSESIDKVRFAVGTVFANGKRQRLRGFMKECEKEGLRMTTLEEECATRWNATHKFLKKCLKYQNPLRKVNNQYVKESDHFLLEENFLEIDQVVKFLEIFKNTTDIFSGQFYSTTACSLPLIGEAGLLLSQWRTVREYQEPVDKMMDKFRKYFYPIPLVLLIGSVLNPCYKLEFTMYMVKDLLIYMGINDDQSFDDCISSLKVSLYELYEYYSKNISTNVSQAAQPSTNPEPARHSFHVGNLEFMQRMKNKQKQTSGRNELDLYLAQGVVEDKWSNDPLEWWKQNSDCYKILSFIARDVLTIPMSSVPSESVFSQGRQQLGDFRHSLANTSLEMIVCLRDWIKSERRNQGREDIKAEEDHEFDAIVELLSSGENSPEEDANIDIDELAKQMRML